LKAEEATQQRLPSEGTVLIAVLEKDRSAIPEIAKRFKRLGFKIKATEGTHKFLAERGVETERKAHLRFLACHVFGQAKKRQVQRLVKSFYNQMVIARQLLL